MLKNRNTVSSGLSCLCYLYSYENIIFKTEINNRMIYIFIYTPIIYCYNFFNQTSLLKA